MENCEYNLGDRCTIHGIECNAINIEDCMWTKDYKPKPWIDYNEILDIFDGE